MLRQRLITAGWLVALLLGSLLSSSAWPFALLTLALLSAGGWEWGRLNQAGPLPSLSMGSGVALGGVAAMAAGWTVHPPAGLWFLVLFAWCVAVALALRSGPAVWLKLPCALRWMLGLGALWSAWLALAQARSIGINFMLSVLCLVWMADVSAYFGGRAFGRRKLAPSISPGKSWEGVWSGVAGVALLALFWLWLDGRFDVDGPSVYSRLLASTGVFGLALGVLLLCAMSVAGDLVESLVKRAAGAKDSSRLLPGHGGVLDRVDALLPVLPAALALMALGALR